MRVFRFLDLHVRVIGFYSTIKIWEVTWVSCFLDLHVCVIVCCSTLKVWTVTWVFRFYDLRIWVIACCSTFYVTNSDADIGSLKSLYTLFDKYLDHMLVKFEQNRIVLTTQRVVLFDKKWLTMFDKVLTPFWKTFLWLKQLFDAKLLIQRLSSFSVPKITALRHV